jgi:hypothetical protein
MLKNTGTYYEKRGKYKALINWKLLCAISAKGDGVFGVLRLQDIQNLMQIYEKDYLNQQEKQLHSYPCISFHC